MLLEPDSFLNELTKLFTKCKTVGSVYITVKRFTGPPSGRKDKQDKKGAVAGEEKCLLRATDGKRIKLSTVIAHKDHVRFQMAFATILKVQMDALKKKEKNVKKAPAPVKKKAAEPSA
eukprot:tig00001085_g6955.t1